MFTQESLAFLRSFADILNEDTPEQITAQYARKVLPNAQAAFTCWGTPTFSAELLSFAPNLRVVLHGAGTPKNIGADALFARHIRVATAAPVIAEDVAETVLGVMIFSLRHISAQDAIARRNVWGTIDGDNEINAVKRKMKRLNKYLTVGVISCSHVGKRLIELLRQFGVNVLLYDPFVLEEDAKAIGAQLSPLDKLMSQSDVVTIHAPAIPATEGMITAELLSSMKDGALFINTARSNIVDNAALTRELQSGRLYAYLDVFEDEPHIDEKLMLPNVLLTPHLCGGQTSNGDIERGDYIIKQLYTYTTLGTLKHEAVQAALTTMA